MVSRGRERGRGLNVEMEKSAAEERHATVATATRTVDTNAPRGGAGTRTRAKAGAGARARAGVGRGRVGGERGALLKLLPTGDGLHQVASVGPPGSPRLPPAPAFRFPFLLFILSSLPRFGLLVVSFLSRSCFALLSLFASLSFSLSSSGCVRARISFSLWI